MAVLTPCPTASEPRNHASLVLIVRAPGQDRSLRPGQEVMEGGTSIRPGDWPGQQTTPGPVAWGLHMERVTRIELALSAWEADVLPLNYTRVRRRPESVSDCSLTLPHGWPPVLGPRGPDWFSGVGCGCGGPELGRTVGVLERVRVGSECRLEGRPFHPVMWGFVARRAAAGCGSWGRDSKDLMERTVVQCADGHVFSTASFPMQQAERLGPGRLVRCPRCARLRSVVPVALEKR